MFGQNRISTDLLSPRAAYGYIPGLNGLRAIAVLIVIVAHMGLEHIVPGGFGVTVFFFISGFLITRLLLAEREKKGKVGLKQFYIRRLIRLYPALIFMVLGSTLYFKLMGYGGPTLTEFMAALFYFTNFFQVAVRSAGEALPFMSWTHLWSLAVEEHFYMIFPLIVVACGAFKAGLSKNLSRALILILIAVPLWRLFIFYNLDVSVQDYTYMMSDARFDSLAWGCFLSVLLHKIGDISKVRFFIGWLPVIAASLAILVTFILRDEMFRHVVRYAVQGAALFILTLNLYYFRSLSWSMKVLEWAPLAWIGTVSYGLYLWHFPVLDAARRVTEPGVVQIVLTTLVTLGITAFSFYLVEKPFTRLRKRFGSHIPVKPDGLTTARPVKPQPAE